MARDKRANGAGSIYIKHGSYYGRWLTPGRGRTNRRLGSVRRPGTAFGLTRTQAERRLRELMAAIQAVTDPDVTIDVAGEALLTHLEAKSVRGIRGVPLATELVQALDGLRALSTFVADDDLVFAHPETGAPLDRSKVRKRFQAACRRAGVRVVRFHDLRHTFGTRMAATGEVSLRTLQEWMGHRDPKTTMIYADYQPGEREAEIVGRAFRLSRGDSLPSIA